MKLNIVDDFLKENIKTHKEDTFYDGFLAYWEDEKGRKLWLMASGQQSCVIDTEKAICDKVDIEWLRELKEHNKNEIIQEDKVLYYTVENAEEARAVFENGDEDIKKLENYIDVGNNNWCELVCEIETETYLYTAIMERDNIISINEFLSMEKEEVIEWLDWFENNSFDGKRYK